MLGELPGGQAHPHMGRMIHPAPWGWKLPVLGTLSDLASYISPSGCSSVYFILSFNTLVNAIKYFPEFRSCSSKLVKHEEEVLGTSDL